MSWLTWASFFSLSLAIILLSFDWSKFSCCFLWWSLWTLNKREASIVSWKHWQLSLLPRHVLLWAERVSFFKQMLLNLHRLIEWNLWLNKQLVLLFLIILNSLQRLNSLKWLLYTEDLPSVHYHILLLLVQLVICEKFALIDNKLWDHRNLLLQKCRLTVRTSWLKWCLNGDTVAWVII